jgi:hypothetical protein
MLSFIQYITEVAIKASGQSAERHTAQYITPYLPKGPKHAKGSHELVSNVGHLKAGDKVTIHGHSIEDGVHHATVSGSDGKKIKVPTNKLNKPTTRANRGFEQEGALASKLSKSGLMTGGGAGFTGGNDFHLIDKRKKEAKKIRGTEGHPQQVAGEHKSDIKTTAFGQLTLTRHPKTGKWHISDEARARRPEYASHVERATVTGADGKKRSLIDHLNHTEGSVGTTNKSGFHSDDTDLSPAHAYLRDHHVDVLHVDSHGTFRAGASEKKDRHGLNLSPMQGSGRFRVRQKTDNANARTVQFSIKKLNKSDTHLGKDEDIEKMKKVLGHE